MITEQERGFEALIEHLARYRRIDFSGYKHSNLFRQVLSRLQVAGVGDCVAYLAYLVEHPEEYTTLYDRILINVTGFFRDEAAWVHIREAIIPHLLALKPATEPVRVWSAGCASGEETYTLAMLFAEAVGPEAFPQRIKVYATDVDEDALTQARQGVYNDQDLESVPVALRPRYFDTAGSRHVFRPDLRRTIVFGCHDVMRDAPISRVDLLVCRNTLMYFDREAQGNILARFHLSLGETGYLFLGKAELSPAHTQFFQPVSLRHHIFKKVSARAGRVQDGRIPDRSPQPRGPSAKRLRHAIGIPPKARLTESDASGCQAPPSAVRPTPGDPGIAGGPCAAPADLETLNAALELTNEELTTSNAEFASTNEELGSMNEELHSTNEELEALNAELHRRTTEWDITNAILDSVLMGLQVGVAVVDRGLTILLWNHGAEKLWGLRADAIRGRSLLSVDLDLPAEQLGLPGFLAGAGNHMVMTVDASCRGRAFRCRITCTPFLGPGGGRAGVVLVMEEAK